MWLILILVLIGVLLLVAELVLLPGISVAGIGSLLAFGAAIFYAFIQYGVLIGLVGLGTVALSIAGVTLGVRGLKERDKNYLTCRIGIGVNGLFLLGLAGLFIRGLL